MGERSMEKQPQYEVLPDTLSFPQPKVFVLAYKRYSYTDLCTSNPKDIKPKDISSVRRKVLPVPERE